MSMGLIDRAFLAGSHNPSLYYKKFPKATWNQQGGYEIQCTPQEVSALVTQSRGWVKGKRMLCVGTDTLGAERFIYENMGMSEMDYIGNALEANVKAIGANKVSVPTGKYDLITVFGTAKPELLGPFTNVGTFVMYLGIGRLSNNQTLRNSWMSARKKHMTMLQTGGADWETGTGVIKILFVEGYDAVQKPSTESVDAQEPSRNGEGVGSGNPQGDEAPKEIKEEGGQTGKDVPEAPVKRRGRPPKLQVA